VAKLGFGGRKTREGTVVSDKMDKTVVVSVSSTVQHRLYKKMVRRQKHYMAHDEENTAQIGDLVRIVEARPHSRLKRWRLAEVLVKADRPEVAPEEIDLELLGEVKSEDEAAPAEEAAPAPAPEAVLETEPAAEVEPEPEAAAEDVPEDVPAVEEAVAEAPVEEPVAEEPEPVEETIEEPEPQVEAEAPEAEVEAEPEAEEAKE
jgi:small subunit ribosomal protein S17